MSVEDIQEINPEDLATKLEEIIHRENVDYTAVRVVLKALRAVVYPVPISFAHRFAELLYYTPRDFCILMGAMAQRQPDSASQIAEVLVNLLNSPPYKDMAISRIWVGYLFTIQALPISHELLAILELQGSVIEKRQHLLIRGILNDRGYFREMKTRFDEVSDWEKPALMFGAACLAKGEYITWLDTIKDHISDPFSEIYRKWLIANQTTLNDKLNVSLFVKSRSDKILEDFTALIDLDPAF